MASSDAITANKGQNYAEEHIDSSAYVPDVKGAIVDAEVSILNNAEAAAEVFPFFSKPSLRLLAVCSAGYTATVLYGIDGSLLSGINIMPQYQSYFGTTALGGATGLIFSLFYAGSFAAVILGYYLSDKFGRRCPMFVGASIALLGAILQASSHSIEQFRASRFILGMGSWMCYCYGPLYTVEMAHPFWRGRLGGLLMVGVVGGTILAGWLNFGCSYASGEFAWRFPLAFQCLPPVLCLSVSWFVPETPRWLVAQGRNEEAFDILVKYHGNGNTNSVVVRLEYAELLQSIDVDGDDKRWWDFRFLWSDKANIYRAFVLTDYGTLIQWSGNSLGIYYLPVMFSAAGVANFHISLLITVCVAMGALCFAFFGTWLLDAWGRRPCLLFALIGMAITMAILSGLQWNGTPKVTAQVNASIAIIIIFRFIYTIGMTPSESLFTVELLPHNIRAKGQAFACLWNTLVLFASVYAAPTALANLGAKYYLVFVGLNIMQTFIVYFVFPETRGMSFAQAISS